MPCRSLSTADDALRHATDLQKDGLRLCFEEFATVLKANLIEPNAAKLAQQATTNAVPAAGKTPPLLHTQLFMQQTDKSHTTCH